MDNPPLPCAPLPTQRLGPRGWCLVLAAACILYFGTAQRAASWQDSGMFQWRVLTGDYAGQLGLALAHPLYIAAGRLLAGLSQRHLPLLLNAFSGLGMAVALANLAGLTARLTGRRWVGLLTAAMLGVTHTAWWLSTIAEVYTWNVAGLTAELWLLAALLQRPRWQSLAGLALVSGLDLCVHNFALLPLPVYLGAAVVLVARGRLPARALAIAAAAYVLGAGLYLGMTVELAVRTGDVAGAVRSALFGNYQAQVLNVAQRSANLKANAALSAMNFINLLLPLALVGWASLRRLGGPLAACLSLITLVEGAFFLRYPVPDQFTFILPTLVMIALAAGLGVGRLAERGRRWRIAVASACLACIAAQPGFFAVAPALMARAGVSAQRERALPYRDEARYWLVPWKHDERSAQRFARHALSQAAPRGVILADSTATPPLLIVQKLDVPAPEVLVQDPHENHPLPIRDGDAETIRRALAGRPLFSLTALEPAGARAELPPGGVLYELRWAGPP